jgi:transposase
MVRVTPEKCGLALPCLPSEDLLVGCWPVDPVACNPASGWEKGQVENKVDLVRERFFSPRLRVKSYDELNGWLLDQCVTYAKAHRHPELRD